MKKFKRFLCIPLLVLFTMTLLTLPVAAAVTVQLPDGKPAASMKFTLTARLMKGAGGTLPDFGPVEVTTDAKGVFAWPAGIMDTGAQAGFLTLSTTSPSKMQGTQEIDAKQVIYDLPAIIQMISLVAAVAEKPPANSFAVINGVSFPVQDQNGNVISDGGRMNYDVSKTTTVTISKSGPIPRTTISPFTVNVAEQKAAGFQGCKVVLLRKEGIMALGCNAYKD